MVYLVTYDLNKPGQNYSELYEAIKALGVSWWHYLDSTWLVDTKLSADQIRDKILPHIDKNDGLFILKVTTDYSGWLEPAAWNWLKERVKSYAY